MKTKTECNGIESEIKSGVFAPPELFNFIVDKMTMERSFLINMKKSFMQTSLYVNYQGIQKMN